MTGTKKNKGKEEKGRPMNKITKEIIDKNEEEKKMKLYKRTKGIVS